MVPSLRVSFNASFSNEKYHAFLSDLNSRFPGAIDFRISETPEFIPKWFGNKIIDTCEYIIDIITQDGFNASSLRAIPPGENVANQNNHSHFIAFDFGICINEAGEYEPQLIEMQGFPTLFAYEVLLDDVFLKHFPLPANFDCYLGGYTRETYLQLLKEIIVGNHNRENVILLEIFPRKQKTRIDFYCTNNYIGIPIVCVTELITEGRKLFYIKDEIKIEVKRIYNRVIFDDLQQQTEAIQEKGKILFQDLDVEWVPHPNWFYRISKYTLPFINHPYIPETKFLSDIKEIPTDLENYVLKPLFSFAGQGVVIDVTKNDIEKVSDPQNWILQRKVKYADVIVTPDIPAKAEIRIFYFWKPGAARPIATTNLARLSKGKMVGVRYNMDKEWVGGSIVYFEK